ncbi:MAG: class I SAM-dependent rRNA methyltransferase [Anaerolineales bacterium]|nr:class I SAM-dependent rRNA methyltransferase [Anaerolineales bacterium]
MPNVQLNVGREKSVHRGHPWIFSGSIMKVDEGIVPGETVDVLDSSGEVIARGAYSPDSQIRIRIWTWNLSEPINSDFLRSRLEQALTYRKQYLNLNKINAYRLVYGEADGLPGFIVDRYDDILVIQCTTCGADRWRETFIDLLVQLTGIEKIVERSDVDVRELEGLPARSCIVNGDVAPGPHTIRENDMRFWVDVLEGQKTGFYLDQRDNRAGLRKFVNQRDVLDCFTYTGGFAISALIGGAKSVVGVDSSKENLNLARENCKINGISPDNVEWVVGDIFKYLRELRDRNRKFDLIILDPPKFAPTSKHVQKAARGYKDINLLGFKLLRPGGMLCTFSCSGGVGQELFQKIVVSAAIDAGVRARIIKRFSQALDHPVGLNFPEGEYLKGLLLEV